LNFSQECGIGGFLFFADSDETRILPLPKKATGIMEEGRGHVWREATLIFDGTLHEVARKLEG
jgi:hypothetical protein